MSSPDPLPRGPPIIGGTIAPIGAPAAGAASGNALLAIGADIGAAAAGAADRPGGALNEP
ncbi:hypothetical protein [Mycobacterium kiyosense]|uniref:hypothetical protein n=1 Tax=Mycobacterium kiyosense TaxID=2871094 RepID=UPI0022310E63|nr:hypothetical protein [Mycobacterium kiyosense]